MLFLCAWNTFLLLLKSTSWDFPGSPAVKIPPSNAGDVVRSLVGNLISCLPPKPKQNRSNIVTNSIKTLKWSTLKKIFFF